jgi:O-antigen/teichoic acid export membrane protein
LPAARDIIAKDGQLSNQVEPAGPKAGFFGRLSSADHVDSRAGLTRRVFAGVGWLLGQNVGMRVILLASQIVLARILLPSDFASLALAGTVIALFEALISFGVDDVLVQRQRTMRFWTKPAFVTSLGLSIASMLLVIACMPVAVHLYEAPVLYSILPIMALGMPLSALSTVPAAALRAALNFRFLATYTTIELAVGQVATIALAVYGFGVFSFILPGLVLAAVRAAFFWFVARPPLGRLRVRQLRMMGKASSAVFGSRVITAMVGQGDYFVLGLFASKPEVGAYFFAFRLAVQPVRVLAGSLTSVLVPALVTLRSEPLRQGEAALSACRVLAFITMPYCFMQAAVVRPLFGLLFGSKWDGAILPAEILSVGLAFDAVSWIATALLIAQGEFRRLFIYSCIFGPAFFLLIAVGAYFGAATAIGASTGVAIAVSLFYVILPPCFSFAAFRRTGVSLRSIGMIYVNSTAVSTIAIGAAVALVYWVPTGPIAQIAIIVTFGGGLYIVLLRFVSPWTYNYVGNRLRDAIRAKKRHRT